MCQAFGIPTKVRFYKYQYLCTNIVQQWPRFSWQCGVQIPNMIQTEGSGSHMESLCDKMHACERMET